MAGKNISIAKLIAKRLVDGQLKVKARYFWKIADLRGFLVSLPDSAYRFQHQLDGQGVKNLISKPDPEKRLWEHVKYIIKHLADMKDA